MNPKLPITLAAALAAGTLAFGTFRPATAEETDAKASQNDQAGSPSAEAGSDAAATGDSQAPPAAQFPAGIKLDDDPAEDRKGVVATLASITEAAFEKDGFDDYVERLVDQDRNRIGKDGFAERKFDDLNAKVDALRAAWKDKYGDDFELDGAQALAELPTIVGEIDDPKAVARAWPVPAVPEASPDGGAVPAAAKETEGNDDPDLDSNVEKGRDVAIATVPASHGLPALNVSLMQELQGWRIDVPNTLTGKQLHDGLLKHLTHVADMQARWPADKNEAAAMVAHHVLLAAYGVDVEPTGEAKEGSDRPGQSDDAGASDTGSDAAK